MQPRIKQTVAGKGFGVGDVARQSRAHGVEVAAVDAELMEGRCRAVQIQTLGAFIPVSNV